MTTSPVRPMRADARRNRDAILQAARTAFDAEGIFAPIDGIATAAGVGNATLYRNFPTRDDLLAAVLEDGFVELIAASDRFARELEPDAALQEWLYELAWQLRIWHDLPSCMASAVDDAASPVQDVVTRLIDCTRDFHQRASDAGTARNSVSAEDLYELVTAISWAIDRFGDDEGRARARVALATAGAFATS